MLWGWLRTNADAAGGWQGAQSVPRVVEAGGDGRSVVTYPLPELATLRSEAVDWSGLTLSGTATSEALMLDGRMVDLEATIAFDGLVLDAEVLVDTDLNGGDYQVLENAMAAPADCQVCNRKLLKVRTQHFIGYSEI